MDKKLQEAIFGGLLHDIGKVVYRSSSSGQKNHSLAGADFLQEVPQFANEANILDCVRYHHADRLKQARIRQDSPAYLVYFADNVAAATDRRSRTSKEGAAPFDKTLPLSSVFNLLNNRSGDEWYAFHLLEKAPSYPGEKIGITAQEYDNLLRDIKNDTTAIEPTDAYINSLLSILEARLSFVPSSTATKEVADISLFDHSKITAALAGALYGYLQDRGKGNYREVLFANDPNFYSEKAFLMVSCDFSGIQNFIYNVTSDHALKSLRSRSFVLEFFMEHFVDEILAGCNMCRANLIYTGGGHCYLILPNIDPVREYLDRFEKRINTWLLEEFGANLYLAVASCSCSSHDLMNEPAKNAPYEGIYRELGRKLSEKKLHRYDAEELIELNRISREPIGRECKVCGIVEEKLEDDRCSWCHSFIKISSLLLRSAVFFIVSNEPLDDFIFCFKLPTLDRECFCYLVAENDKAIAEKKVRTALSEQIPIRRIYGKNEIYSGLSYATRLFMGDYAGGDTKTLILGDLACQSKGIKRLAVLRADVDNLGQAFSRGFIRDDASNEEKGKYNTLSRTATLSRQLSLFFKYYLNDILNEYGTSKYSWLGDSNNGPLNLITVYSGGDDIFLLGSWDSVIEAALRIHDSFEKFTGGALTLSAGIGIFPAKFPIYRAAADTAELEKQAKEYPDKNAISLFSAMHEYDNEMSWGEYHCYSWREFTDGVLSEKLKRIKDFFEADNQERGHAFLYQLLHFLRNSEKERINIARYAYLLGRMEPPKSNVKANAIYKVFSKDMYQWIWNEDDKRQLISAIEIYVYLTRDKEEME